MPWQSRSPEPPLFTGLLSRYGGKPGRDIQHKDIGGARRNADTTNFMYKSLQQAPNILQAILPNEYKLPLGSISYILVLLPEQQSPDQSSQSFIVLF